MKKRILILGSSGLLGSSLVPEINKLHYETITHSFSKKSDFKVDLCNEKNVFRLLKETSPDLIINLIALTDVDYCQENPHEAYNINVVPVINITNYIMQSPKPIHLIQISTDQVYDNDIVNHSAEHNVSIKNVYAFSKISSEIVTSKVHSSILRTNFFGKSLSENRDSFTDWIYKNLKYNKTLNAFDNVYFNPLSIQTLCSVITNFIDKKYIGIYNVGSIGYLTKSDFIILFAKSLNLSIDNIIKMPVETALPNSAYRPRNMLMDVRKLEKKMNIKLPNIIDEIKLCSKEYL